MRLVLTNGHIARVYERTATQLVTVAEYLIEPGTELTEGDVEAIRTAAYPPL